MTSADRKSPQIAELHSDLERLQGELTRRERDAERLQHEKSRLQRKSNRLQRENDRLKQENERLKQQLDEGAESPTALRSVTTGLRRDADPMRSRAMASGLPRHRNVE